MVANDQLSRSFAALADPTRPAILERLAVGDAGVVELAAASTLTQPAITKHLKVLERAGLIGRARDRQRRPAGIQPDGPPPTLPHPAITKHLKVLERAGLIGRARDGQRRPARLHLEGLLPVDDWLRRAHPAWYHHLDRLEAHLAAQTESTITEENPDA